MSTLGICFAKLNVFNRRLFCARHFFHIGALSNRPYNTGQSGDSIFIVEAHSHNPSSKYTRNRMEGDSVPVSCQHIKSEELCKGKWIALSEITYKDPKGNERKWETVCRTTRTGDGADAAVIVPILKQAQKADCLVLVKQYRPPLKAYSLEFPAGLIDKGEGPFECAVRELKEETGYQCTPKHTSPGVSLDPGLSNSIVNMVTVEIDGDEESNKQPMQQQDDTEFIEVIIVPVEGLLNTLSDYAKDGVQVHSILYTYALAVSHMQKL